MLDHLLQVITNNHSLTLSGPLKIISSILPYVWEPVNTFSYFPLVSSAECHRSPLNHNQGLNSSPSCLKEENHSLGNWTLLFRPRAFIYLRRCLCRSKMYVLQLWDGINEWDLYIQDQWHPKCPLTFHNSFSKRHIFSLRLFTKR